MAKGSYFAEMVGLPKRISRVSNRSIKAPHRFGEDASIPHVPSSDDAFGHEVCKASMTSMTRDPRGKIYIQNCSQAKSGGIEGARAGKHKSICSQTVSGEFVFLFIMIFLLFRFGGPMREP